MLSWAIARKLRPVAIYDSLLMGDGISLKQMPSYRGAQDYENLPVAAIMTHDVVSANSWETAKESLAHLRCDDLYHHAYTVLNRERGFVGIVTLHELKECDPATRVSDLISEQIIIQVYPDFSIRGASRLMIAHGIQQLPVVSAADKNRLIGTYYNE